MQQICPFLRRFLILLVGGLLYCPLFPVAVFASDPDSTSCHTSRVRDFVETATEVNFSRAARQSFPEKQADPIITAVKRLYPFQPQFPTEFIASPRTCHEQLSAYAQALEATLGEWQKYLVALNLRHFLGDPAAVTIHAEVILGYTAEMHRLFAETRLDSAPQEHLALYRFYRELGILLFSDSAERLRLRNCYLRGTESFSEDKVKAKRYGHPSSFPLKKNLQRGRFS